MTVHRATVERDGRFWLVKVEGVGATQARRLGELEAMTIDLIEVVTGEHDPTVVYEFRLPQRVRSHLDRADRLRATEAKARSEAAAEVRAAARELHDGGISARDVGRVLGVSPQRAHQLLSAGR